MKTSDSSQDLYDGKILFKGNSDTINKKAKCYLFCIDTDVLVSSQNLHHFYFYIYKYIFIDWVPGEADSETEISIGAFLRKCSGDQHLGGEGREEGWDRGRNCAVMQVQCRICSILVTRELPKFQPSQPHAKAGTGGIQHRRNRGLFLKWLFSFPDPTFSPEVLEDYTLHLTGQN